MIRISPQTARRPPTAGALTVTDEEWRLDPDRYGAFVEAVTGLTLPSDPDPGTCYRIGNRIEAFVESRKRNGEWSTDLVERYPGVDSLEEILGLARFFRECHTCCLDGH